MQGLLCCSLYLNGLYWQLLNNTYCSISFKVACNCPLFLLMLKMALIPRNFLLSLISYCLRSSRSSCGNATTEFSADDHQTPNVKRSRPANIVVSREYQRGLTSPIGLRPMHLINWLRTNTNECCRVKLTRLYKETPIVAQRRPKL